MRPVGKLPITAYQAGEASGSDISNPRVDSGYQPALVAELARIGSGGGAISVDAEGARDLAEWAGDLSDAVAQAPNLSGARSLSGLADRALALARRLEAS